MELQVAMTTQVKTDNQMAVDLMPKPQSQKLLQKKYQ
jgi:hypothetical protein